VALGSIVPMGGHAFGNRSVVGEDVPKLIALLGLPNQEIAERLNRELGITLVSEGVVRLWAEGWARPPLEWIETLTRLRARPTTFRPPAAPLAHPRAS
jgi:hypothetical protein